MTITIEVLREYREALVAKFGKSGRTVVSHASQTQFSIARHYGGCTIQGKLFIYNPDDDSLIREDVFKWATKRQRESKRDHGK